jgi:hypothetical protein
MSTPLKNPGPISYTATILQSERANNSWARVEFPYDLKELYGKGNLVPAIISFDGIIYRGSITKMGGKYPLLLIRRDILAQLKKKKGDTVAVIVTLDDKPREVTVPPELVKLFAKNAEAKAIFEKLAYTHRKEYCRWVDEAKQQETKDRRALKTIEMLLKR